MTSIKLSVDDPEFVDKIIYEVKSQGHFDVFRKECLADVDTQPAYQNLHSRVEDSVQKFLKSQVWTPETNKNRLREEMRHNIVRAGFLETGVSRIVDQIIEQKMDYIQSKVEEILYQYVGIEKQNMKKEKEENGTLEIDTDLLPTDLEQVSPDSDKKSTEAVEEEVIEDFESPAFEPIVNETIMEEKNQNSNLSAISGLTSDGITSQDSQTEKVLEKDETMLSQVSSSEKISVETPNNDDGMICEEAQMAPEIKEETNKTVEPIVMEAPTFDLNKDAIEFTGTERKNLSLDDSTNSNDVKIPEPPILPPLPQEPLSSQMEIDDNYTTDSSEIKMEIDIKDETTQESNKVEESSQDSTLKTKEKDNKDSHHHHKHHKRERSKDRHKSSSTSTHKSSSSSSHRHHSSKSSSSRHESDKHKSRSKSSSHKSDKEKDRSSSSSHKKSKHRDDHHSSSSKSRRRSTEQESANEEKINKNESEKFENEKLSKNESSLDIKKKSSILVKYDYLKTEDATDATSNIQQSDDDGDDFLGFTNSDNQAQNIENHWIQLMKNESERNKKNSDLKTAVVESATNSKTKAKQKSKSPDSPLTTSNSGEEIPQEKSQQRYETQDLYKPRFDFSNRARGNRRGQNIIEETSSGETIETSK